MADEFSVATALPTFGFSSEKPGQSASSSLEDAAGMPHFPAPVQTSVLARFVCHCLSVCGLLRLTAKCVAHATKTRKRTPQDSCIPHTQEHKTARMPHVPGPAQTSVLARLVCNCLSVCGLLRLGAKCVAHARKTRDRASQDSCIQQSHEKA